MRSDSLWRPDDDRPTGFLRGRNAVVAALDAWFRGGNAPRYDKPLEDQFSIVHGTPASDGSIRDVLLRTTTREQLAFVVENLIAAAAKVSDSAFQVTSTLEAVTSAVSTAFAEHPALSLRLAKIDGTFEVVASGAAEIDAIVVDHAVAWLATYPAVRAEAQKSRRLLAEGDLSGSLNAARVALEMLARATLNNAKSLEKQLTGEAPLLAWLRRRGATVETVNLFHRMANSFCDFQNSWVKHPPATGSTLAEAEAEFGVYVAFTLMRLITGQS